VTHCESKLVTVISEGFYESPLSNTFIMVKIS
jgi:hypothetical protein